MIDENFDMIINNKIVYDNVNKRYLHFDPDEVGYTDYHPKKGERKRVFLHMCSLYRVNPKTMGLEFVGQNHKFDVYQKLIEYEYREITKSEKARFLLRWSIK